MKRRTNRALAWAVVLLASSAGAMSGQELAVIEVSSPAMTTGVMMPREYTPDGRNISPPLRWEGVPAGTRQLVVLCEDHGAGNPPPWVHWLVYNIPATATGLPAELPIYPDAPLPPELNGAVQGNNGWNRPYYRGPAPPAGQVHNYSFVVYALDAELNLPPGLNRAAVMERIEGHVIGKGEMVPFYIRQPVTAAVRR